jgi:hypothetical protein
MLPIYTDSAGWRKLESLARRPQYINYRPMHNGNSKTPMASQTTMSANSPTAAAKRGQCVTVSTKISELAIRLARCPSDGSY